VKGDIQAMAAIPHQKGFESICAVDAGNRGGTTSERISFVTAGTDKTVVSMNRGIKAHGGILTDVNYE
jgi:hypothetical protein